MLMSTSSSVDSMVSVGFPQSKSLALTRILLPTTVVCIYLSTVRILDKNGISIFSIQYGND